MNKPTKQYRRLTLDWDDTLNFSHIQDILVQKHKSFRFNNLTLKYLLQLIVDHPEIIDKYKVKPRQLF